MSLRIKALGLGLIAAMAVSAVAVMSASANEKGHFVTTGLKHAQIKGFAGPGTDHNLHFIDPVLGGEIGCNTQTYTAHTTTAETTTSITVTPAYGGCFTTPNGNPGSVTVTMNGCTYTFTVAEKTTDSTEQTVHLLCPPGNTVEIHHPSCTISIHAQTIEPTVATPTTITYTTKTSPSGIHEITMHVDVKFDITRHGLCQFVAPTNGKGRLLGSVTVKAFNTNDEQAHLTAT